MGPHSAKGDATFDTRERKKIYNRSREYVSDQMFFLPLLHESCYEGYNKKVQNMSTFNDAASYAYHAHLWLKK